MRVALGRKGSYAPPVLTRRFVIPAAVGLALVGAFVVGYRASAGNRATTPVAAPALVDEVRSTLAARYYRAVPDSVLRLGSVEQMIAALGDPYTTYLEPDAYRLLRQETASTYSGIGASVLPSPNGFVVVSLRSGPARRAGIRVGDTIVSIGGRPAKTLTMAQTTSKILGPPGTSVGLVLTRGGHRLSLDVRRELIKTPAVHARLISYAGRRWGHVKIGTFCVGASVVLRREVRALEAQGAQGLVLDLRENPGGLLTQAVSVSSVFMNRGVIATLEGAHQPQRVLRATGGAATALPLVVLVDRYTASSAEIVAAALRDNQRATIVGEHTFGKALVQAVDPLDNGAALELTIAQYSTPAGEDLSGVGLTPQIRALDVRGTRADEALAQALRVLARPTS